jgi:hypothetical protein
VPSANCSEPSEVRLTEARCARPSVAGVGSATPLNGVHQGNTLWLRGVCYSGGGGGGFISDFMLTLEICGVLFLGAADRFQPTWRMKALFLVVGLPFTIGHEQIYPGCESVADCGYNGECRKGSCVCEMGWKGCVLPPPHKGPSCPSQPPFSHLLRLIPPPPPHTHTHTHMQQSRMPTAGPVAFTLTPSRTARSQHLHLGRLRSSRRRREVLYVRLRNGRGLWDRKLDAKQSDHLGICTVLVLAPWILASHCMHHGY